MTTTGLLRFTGIATCALAALGLVAAEASAAIFTWDGGDGASPLWSEGTNWVGDSAPTSASDTEIIFAGTNNMGSGGTPLSQDIGNPLELNRLEIANVASGDNPVFLGGNQLRFVANGLAQPGLFGDRDQSTDINNAIEIPTGTTLTVRNRTWQIYLNGPISGDGKLVFDTSAGGGELNLGAANSYTGGTEYVHTGGTSATWKRLWVRASGALGTGDVTIQGGNLNPTTSQAGGLTFAGTTTQANDFTLLADSPIFADKHDSSGADVTLTGNLGLGGHTLYLRGGGTGNITGVIDDGAITKIDDGTWTLSGVNTYSGATTVNDGVLRQDVEGALGSTSGVTVADGATFDFGSYRVYDVDFTISGDGHNGLGALYSAGGDLQGRIGVALADDASIRVDAGRLDIGINRPLVGNGHTLTKLGAGNLPIRSAAGTFGAIEVEEGTLYFETPQDGMTGTPITVAAGARIGTYYNTTVAAPVTLNGGTLQQFNSPADTGNWTGDLTIGDTSTLAASGGNLALSGDITGSASLIVTGPHMVTLSGSNNGFTGPIDVQSGVLKLGGVDALGNTSGVTVHDGATLDMAGWGPGSAGRRNVTIAGTGVADQGALNVSGGGYSQIAGLELTADSKVNATGRLDTFGPLAGNHVLTKTGSNVLAVRGGVSPADPLGGLVINQGRVRFENAGFGSWTGPVTVNPGAILSAWNSQTTGVAVNLNGGTLAQENSGTGTYNGPVTVNADSSVDVGPGNIHLNGPLSGSGNLTTYGANTLAVNASGSVGGIRGDVKVALGAGVNLAIGANGDDNIWAGEVSGPGSIQKVGGGLLAMNNASSSYSGGSTVSGGDLASLVPGALGTGTVALDGGTLNLAVPLSGAAGFAAGWTVNGDASVAGNDLTVTTSNNSRAGSAFLDVPVATSDFTIQFTYSADMGSGNPADGLAIVFQNDIRGPTALGASGGAIGYTGGGSIQHSAAVAMNLYNPGGGRGIGQQLWTNGNEVGGFESTSPVELYGTPLDVELSYDGSTLTVVLTQGADTFTKSYAGIDLPGTVGPMAFFGFTGGTGGEYARQQVSGFSFVSTAVPGTDYSNDLAVTAGQAGDVDVLVTPFSAAYSMGGLSMGAGSTLGVAPIDGSVPDLAYNLTLGATMLDAAATFDVANNGAGVGTLALGAVADNGAVGSLTKTGDGTLRLTETSPYEGDTTVLGGTLALGGGSANGIPNSPNVRVGAGAVLNVAELSGGTMALTAGQVLRGAGTVEGTVGGEGQISPGTSPGVLTATAVDPAGGIDFAFQFTAAGDPDYGSPDASINDVLRLTDPADPFTADLDAGNTVGFYFDVDSMGVGDVFRGGFYTDKPAEFLDAIAGADLQFFVRGDGNGPVEFEGTSYYALEDLLGVGGFSLSTVYAPTEFLAGEPVGGFVMQITAVPEPSTLALASLSLAGLVLLLLRRRR